MDERLIIKRLYQLDVRRVAQYLMDSFGNDGILMHRKYHGRDIPVLMRYLFYRLADASKRSSETFAPVNSDKYQLLPFFFYVDAHLFKIERPFRHLL